MNGGDPIDRCVDIRYCMKGAAGLSMNGAATSVGGCIDEKCDSGGVDIFKSTDVGDVIPCVPRRGYEVDVDLC